MSIYASVLNSCIYNLHIPISLIDTERIIICTIGKLERLRGKKYNVPLSKNIISLLQSFGWLTKVYVWKRSGPSNVILHRFCLTKGSTKSSQESHPRSVVYVSKLTKAIWRYLLSEFRALLCLSSAQYLNRLVKLYWTKTLT